MVYRKFALFLAVAALALFVSIPVMADDAKANKDTEQGSTHEGKVVSITGDKLVMTDKEGKEHSHTLASNARLTCDGKVCKADDLKAGMKIRVMTKKGDRDTVIQIDALNKDTEFPKLSNTDKPRNDK